MSSTGQLTLPGEESLIELKISFFLHAKYSPVSTRACLKGVAPEGVALNILSRFRGEDSINATAGVLADDAPLVRYEAVKAISALIPTIPDADHQKKKYSLLVPLLKDPILAVRSETARALTEVPAEYFDPQHMKDFETALDEFKQRQESIADRPEAHLNLGIMYENLGEDGMAEASYKTAIRLANDFYPARFNLANFYNRAGRNREAEQQFREIIKFRQASHHFGGFKDHRFPHRKFWVHPGFDDQH